MRGLATQFGGNWLEFRRFEEHNGVDRERFPSFDNQLRAAMFEEPVRFLTDVFSEGRSVLDLLYGQHTIVNAPLAKHPGRDVDHSGAGSVALASSAVLNGARIVRAHDVAATVDAIRVAAAVSQGEGFDGT